MPQQASVGHAAPDFDLSSTEGCVLSLRDEVPRSAVIIYCFADPSDESARAALSFLAEHADAAPGPSQIFGISTASMDELTSLQRELHLPFPLLRDDRGLTAAYGFRVAEEGPTESVMAVIDRGQKLIWERRAAEDLAAIWHEVVDCLKRTDRPTSNYPRSVVNRLVSRKG